MAYQIQGNVIITDSRDLVGVNTAGFDIVYVGEDINLNGANGTIEATKYLGDGSSLVGVLTASSDLDGEQLVGITTISTTGNVTVGGDLTVTGKSKFGGTGIEFSTDPTVNITGFSTDATLSGNSDSSLPTQKAVKTYVDGSLAGNVKLDVEGDSGTISLNLASQALDIQGTGDQIITEAISGVGGTFIKFKLPDALITPKDLEVSDGLEVKGIATLGDTTVGVGSTLSLGNLRLSNRTVTAIGIDTGLAGDSDQTLPTEKAVKAYVDSNLRSSGTLTVGDGGVGITTIDLASESLAILETANETTVNIGNNSVTVGVSSTLVLGQSLTVTDSLTANDALVNALAPLNITGNTPTGVALTAGGDVVVAGDIRVTGINSINTPSIAIDGYYVSGVSSDTDLGTGSGSLTLLPTQSAVKSYVDDQIGGSSSLNFVGDSGIGTGQVSLENEILSVNGTPNQVEVETGGFDSTSIVVGLTDSVTIVDNLGVGRTITASDAKVTGGVLVEGSTAITGPGIALSVSNNVEVGGSLYAEKVEALSGQSLSIDGGGSTINLDNGSVVAAQTLSALGQLEAAATTGVGLTVRADAYVSGSLTVDGQLLAQGGVDFDEIIVTGIQAEGPEALLINGTTPGASNVGVAFTNGNVSVNDDLTVKNNFAVQLGSLTAGGQLRADATGIGLTVKGTSYFNGEIDARGGIRVSDTDGLTFGAVGVAVTEIITDLSTPGATDAQLPTARAVQLVVDGGISGIALSFTDGTTTDSLSLGAEELLFQGTTGEIDVVVGAANSVTFALPDALVVPNTLEVTSTSEFKGKADFTASSGVALEVDGAAQFDGGVSFNGSPIFNAGFEVATGVATVAELKLGTSAQTLTKVSDDNTFAGVDDSTIPTALAVKEFVENTAGGISSVTVYDGGSVTDRQYVAFASTATGAAQFRTDENDFYFVPSTGILNAQEFNALSDARFKRNIEVIVEPLAKVGALRGVTFDWLNHEGSSAGLIAQELKQVMPDLVTESPEKMTVNYNGVIGLLVEAVKELTARVEELESRN